MTEAPTLWRHARLATLDGPEPWGWVEDGALLTEGDRIAWVGAEADLPAALRRLPLPTPAAEHDLHGALTAECCASASTV